jgi:hypothetical protein
VSRVMMGKKTCVGRWLSTRYLTGALAEVLVSDLEAIVAT